MRWNYLVTALTLALFSGMAWGQEFLPETAKETTPPTESTPANAGMLGDGFPLGSQPLDSANLFGGRTGYIHPFLSLSTIYTSNLFRTASNEQSDRYAVIVPGIWLALPARNQRMPEIGTSNTAPGGLSLSRFTMERERRVQGYALYQANILKYDRFQEEDRVDHRAEGMLKFSSRGGLSLELVDVYERNSDPYGTGAKADGTLDTFDANLFNAILVSRLSPKMLLRADYGRYHLNYADASNSFRDRNDNSYSGYLFFQTTPRTALFVQGEHIAIDYEESGIDSRHNNYYLGVQMQTSANTRGRFKIGYGMQDYGTTDSNDFLAEAQLDYFFTPKTSFYLRGTRLILETDLSETNQTGTRNILSHRALLGYRQRITVKWSADASLFFNRSEYDGTVIIDNRIASDYFHDEFGGRAALGFSPFRWMDLSLGYEYRERDSNFNSEDYQSNTVFLRATAAL
jgi:hypothetical protein